MKTLKTYGTGFTILAFSLGLLGGCVADNHVKVLYSNESQEADREIQWHQIREGLAYAHVLASHENGRKELFLAKVDPRLFEFKIFNNANEKDAKSLREIHQQEGSVLTFNGAFFDTDFKAMGLLQDSESISHKKISSELMNGIFVVSNTQEDKGKSQQAKVHSLDKAPKDKDSFMIQNGPVLIDAEGSIPLTKDTGKLAARTAVGVDSEGNVILVILHQSLLNTDNALSLYQFAYLLKEHALFAPLSLHSVLNLDGGPSTGVMIGNQYLPEINNVQNVIITIPRT